MHLGGSSTVKADTLPVDPLAQPEGDRVGATVSEPLPVLQSEEASSSSTTMSAPSTLPVGRLHMLNDGPKADAWLELMKKWGTIHELVTFFYNSLSGMMGRAEEFIGL